MSFWQLPFRHTHVMTEETGLRCFALSASAIIGITVLGTLYAVCAGDVTRGSSSAAAVRVKSAPHATSLPPTVVRAIMVPRSGNQTQSPGTEKAKETHRPENNECIEPQRYGPKACVVITELDPKIKAHIL